MNQSTTSIPLAALLTLCACGHLSGDELPPPAAGGLDQRGSALYVALGKSAAVAVIDVDSWRLAGKVQLAAGYYPHHLALSPDGARVAVAAPAVDLSGGHGGHGGGALYLLDSRSGDVAAQGKPGGTAHNLAFLPDGSTLVFALSEHGSLHLASASLKITGTVAVGADPLEATVVPGGRALVANSGSGTVSVVDVLGKQVQKTLTVGQEPTGAWLGGDGVAYVTSESDRKLSVVELAGYSVRQTVELPGTPGQAATTIDGKELWVALEDARKVLILRSADLSVLGEVAVGTRPHGLVADPAGRVMYLTDEGDGKVYALDVARRGVERSLDIGGSPNGILYRGPS